MSNEVYDVLKWVALIFIPALATLVGAIGSAVGWDATGLAVTIITAVGTFIGACIGVSSKSYDEEEG